MKSSAQLRQWSVEGVQVNDGLRTARTSRILTPAQLLEPPCVEYELDWMGTEERPCIESWWAADCAANCNPIVNSGVICTWSRTNGRLYLEVLASLPQHSGR
jgi:hypothetical protein